MVEKYIYLDESGDLGFNFSSGSSKIFVVTFIETSLNKKQLDKILKITKQRTIKKEKLKKVEIKGSISTDKTKKFLIEMILDEDISIKSIIVNKFGLYENLRKNKEKLYNWINGMILKECSYSKIELIVDKRHKKNSFVEDYNQYVKKKMDSKNVNIQHKYSHSESGLQIVDVICNSIFKAFEFNNNSLYNLFKKKVKFKCFKYGITNHIYNLKTTFRM
jgi:hypothetical protein